MREIKLNFRMFFVKKHFNEKNEVWSEKKLQNEWSIIGRIIVNFILGENVSRGQGIKM